MLRWKIDEAAVYFDRVHLRGWCHVDGRRILEVHVAFDGAGEKFRLQSFGSPSDDVAASLGMPAHNVRFDEWLVVPVQYLGRNFHLILSLEGGLEMEATDGLTNGAHGDPYFQIWENFLQLLGSFESGSVLEIGSRARSGVIRKHRIPTHLNYIGLDILDGPNVDVVGDVHELARLFPNTKFAAIFSASVFEHLAMPWKVAIEANRVLEPGGIIYTASHQTWPLHEQPWDFWRFSSYSWKTLFNSSTGFEILESVMGEPARVHAVRTNGVTKSLPESVAYLGSASIAKKISETVLTWDVPVEIAAGAMYPTGELKEAPDGTKT